MNNLIPIKVKCHSGYKADEYPMYFYWDCIRFEISDIIDRWYLGENNPEFPPANYFKVRTADTKIYLLKYETRTNKWFLLIHEESMNL